MSAPNLLTSSSVVGKTAYATLATTTANVITNAAGSNTCAKVENIILTNSTNATVTANVTANRSSTNYYLGGNIGIPGYSTLVLLGKDTSIYLEEGDTLQANASSSGAITLSIGYELISV